jgi:hypothetical protein
MLISLRIPKDLLEFVDAEALRRKWSRNATINHLVEYGLQESESEPRPTSKPATFKDGTPDVGLVGLARLLEKESSHDPKTCRVYGCLMCKMAKETK